MGATIHGGVPRSPYFSITGGAKSHQTLSRPSVFQDWDLPTELLPIRAFFGIRAVPSHHRSDPGVRTTVVCTLVCPLHRFCLLERTGPRSIDQEELPRVHLERRPWSRSRIHETTIDIRNRHSPASYLGRLYDRGLILDRVLLSFT